MRLSLAKLPVPVLTLFLLLGAILRLVYIKFYPGIYDVDGYVTLAQSILKHKEFALIPGIPTMESTPIFPLWIASLFAVFGSTPYVILVCNVVLSTATGFLIYLLGTHIFSYRIGLIAAALWSFYPYSIYYCAWTYRETFLVCLAAIMLWLLDSLFRRRTLFVAAASGFCGALLALTNPSSLIFVTLTALLLFVKGWSSGIFKLLSVYYLCFGLCYAPWVIRNNLVFGRPVLTNLHGGMNLYYGVMLSADDLGTDREKQFRLTDPIEQLAEKMVRSGHEGDADQLWHQAAQREIYRAPRRYIQRCLERIAKFWRFVPYHRVYSMNYSTLFWVSLLSDGIFLTLGFVGLIYCSKRWRELLPFLAILIFWPLAYYFVYTVIRFRMPIMPVVILFTAVVIDRIWEFSTM